VSFFHAEGEDMIERGQIFGMATSAALPLDWMPIEGIAVIKCLDAQGDPRLFLTSTPTLSQWEAVGMLTAGLDDVRDDMSKIFVAPEQADEDD
jgi:hypothetical protein